jgi:iron(III) transport system substrate-binding protein
MLRIRTAAISAAAFVAVATSSWTPAGAQALVVDGEEIADAKLFAAARAEGSLSVYGTYPTENLAETLDAFRADTGLKLDYIRVGSSRLYERVVAEFSAGKLNVDYVDLTDYALVKEWMSRDILAVHRVPWNDRISPKLRDKNGHWVYVYRPVQTVAVNTELVKPADYPKSWKDTFDPKWTDKIGMPSIDGGGAARTLFAFLRLEVDPQAWEKVAALNPRTYTSSAPTVNDLVRGRTAIAYGGASSFTEQIENGAPLKIILPTEGVAAFGGMGNVTTTAKHPNAAKIYVNYLTSKKGSTLISKTGSYGTHPDSPAPIVAGTQLPPQDKVWIVTAEQWDTIHDSWFDEWKSIFNRK